MKRNIAAILAVVCVIFCFASIQSVFAEAVNVDYKVMLNKLEQSGIQLKSENDRTLIPIRDFGEMLNATVYWLEETETIQIVMQDRTVVFRIGAPNLTVLRIINGVSEVVLADVPLPDGIAPQIIEGKTYIPLRGAAVPLLIGNIEDISTETLRTDLEEEPSFKWNGDENRVEIYGVTEPVVKNSIADLASLSSDIHYSVIGRLVYVGEDSVKWRLVDLNNPEVSIELKDPAENINNFWEQQLDTQDPNGRVVMMSGFVYRDGDKSYIAVKRTTTGMRPVRRIILLEKDRECTAEVYYKDRTNEDIQIVSGDKIPVGVKLYAKNLSGEYEINVYTLKDEKIASVSDDGYIMPDSEIVIKAESTEHEIKSQSAELYEAALENMDESVSAENDANEGE